MQEDINKFKEIRHTYNQLGEKVSQIITENLELKLIKTHAVAFRVKTTDSFQRKILNKTYIDPLSDITDLLGIRIIAYVEDDVKTVCAMAETLFVLDQVRSINKNDELGADRVGYKSIHLICKLGSDRTSLPEFVKFKDMSFEIQVRTILQHSWAEIEHDKNYKYSGVLPPELRRRLMLLSGTLELVDREFNQLSKEIDNYSQSVRKHAQVGSFDIELNSLSLMEYLNVKFDILKSTTDLDPYFIGEDEQILKELFNFGIKTIRDLDNIIPVDLIEKTQHIHANLYLNYIGLLRDIMMISDIDRYLAKSYTSNFMLVKDMAPLLMAYNVNLKKFPGDHVQDTLNYF
ncbi:GTP pyrophosphokinase [Pedobacter duraquae]|uniref:PpGpp synthetase/RelA/SpoT-type nucleotidyltransferase n=1 Tax=Pedobacter duraquae TaxID=425511 RepID=A0A4R6IG52_9SPHI|nr:hypothetical protein [Pedobacter duraquae]TDO21330.1 ppGpp synthetase/RelA/SpoT-type nucleotidyltransferase [Pedobacter duraquae]